MSESKEASRSWFCVLNNPEKIFGNDKKPDEMVEIAIDKWCKDKPERTCAINYEIGDQGTPHMHMVLEDPAKARFTAVQKLFPSIHIERTRGNKEQAEDYINKRGRFEEKNHTVVVPARYRGQIKACQGARNDLSVIEDLLDNGLTPSQIMDKSLLFRKQETLIRKAYFAKRVKETPPIRDVEVTWHVGNSGTGKSYIYYQLVQEYGEDHVYLMTDYGAGGFDLYEGQQILVMDEFKGSMKFQELLNYCDKYKIQIHCRYANGYALWTVIHITSIYPPEEAYKFMVDQENRDRDRIDQLMRRLTYIVYHYKVNGEYKAYKISAEEYQNYEQLKNLAHGDRDGFIPLDSASSLPLPFD